jgi:hypothetical protein
MSTKIPVSDELRLLTIKFAVDSAYKQMQRNLNTQLFGARKPPKPSTRRQRWANRARMYRERVKDAWLVLTGKADIGDSW